MSSPGMVCAHHHLYSALARGMPAPPATPTNFLSILENVWWRLDRALDLGAEGTQGGGGVEHVLALEQSVHSGLAHGKRAHDQGSMRDRLVTGDSDTPLEAGGFIGC